MVSAGLQKLVLGNWLIQPGSNMEQFLLFKAVIQAREKGIVLPQVVQDMTHYPMLLAVLGLMVMAAEVLSPLTLSKRWPALRWALIGTLFGLQLWLAVVAKTLASFPWLGAYFFFVPWDVVGRRLRQGWTRVDRSKQSA